MGITTQVLLDDYDSELRVLTHLFNRYVLLVEETMKYEENYRLSGSHILTL